jgi:cysteine-rich repeat protein
LHQILLTSIRGLVPWGNGSVQPSQSEEWDDGNNDDGDGWSSVWLIEPGYTCINSPSEWFVCGDGVIAAGEQWDDGNTSDGDGCSSTCQIEAGYTCTGVPSQCYNWGNGIVETLEGCDDGNNFDGDGWSSAWAIEPGFTWTGSPSQCYNWGDGIVQTGEQWDDGNGVGGDGCSPTWTIEPGYSCLGSPSQWYSWGNGILETGEQCDDGNSMDNDGCSSSWTVEANYSCTATSPSVWTSLSTWGNGVIESVEEWDDGNLEEGDGCNRSWFVEENYSCTGQPSIWVIDVEESLTEKIIGTTVQATLIAGELLKAPFWFCLGISAQFLASSFIQQSLVGMWIMVNSLQTLRYLALFHLYLSKFIFVFLSYINFLWMQNDFLTNLYIFSVDEEDLKQNDISDYRFINQGIDNRSIILSGADIFMSLALIFVQFLVIIGLSFAIKPRLFKK